MSKLKVGDKLVERGEIFRIFKIQIKKYNGETERIIHYRNYYTNSLNSSLFCSVPECNMGDHDIRSPVSKKEMKDALKRLRKKPKNTDALDVAEAKTVLNSNDVHQTLSVLKKYWREKKRDDENFTKAKRDVLSTAIERVVEETALVSGVSLDKAKDKIILGLSGS